MSETTLRPNVCLFIINRDKKLFLGERFGEPGVWQFPQGGVEPDSSLEDNVLRELWEETGISSEKARILKRFKHTYDYNWKTPPKYAIGKWHGQSQTFWLIEFLGEDSDIRLDLHDQEFSAWRWCSINQVRELAEPKRLKGYEGALSELEEGANQ